MNTTHTTPETWKLVPVEPTEAMEIFVHKQAWINAVNAAPAAPDPHGWSMCVDARASLRHWISAAILFGHGPQSMACHGKPRDIHGEVLAAFDKWFELQDWMAQKRSIEAGWPFKADATHPGMQHD